MFFVILIKNYGLVVEWRDVEDAVPYDGLHVTRWLGAGISIICRRGGALLLPLQQNVFRRFESVGEGLRALPQQIKTTREGMEPLPYKVCAMSAIRCGRGGTSRTPSPTMSLFSLFIFSLQHLSFYDTIS